VGSSGSRPATSVMGKSPFYWEARPATLCCWDFPGSTPVTKCIEQSRSQCKCGSVLANKKAPWPSASQQVKYRSHIRLPRIFRIHQTQTITLNTNDYSKYCPHAIRRNDHAFQGFLPELVYNSYSYIHTNLLFAE